MYSRLLTPHSESSFFLFGPRGTGKTRWVQATFPNAIYLDLLKAELFNTLLANPSRLEQFIPSTFKDWVVLDEVQKIPELLDEVHRLIENRKIRFILTGSSARKLKRKEVNLLAGRARTYFLHPLTAMETGNDFKLEQALQFGELPTVYNDADPKGYLESYVQTYLKEEIQQEGLTRNIAAFSRFLEAASFSQGSILNMTEVSRECAVERKVVENYFIILEDLLLAWRLPVFTKRARRQMVSHPKFYFFDAGVYRTLRPRGPIDRPEEIEGAAFETLFLQELKAINDYLHLEYQLFYWRTFNKMEVDFIAYGPKGLLAFEIKRAGKIGRADLRGLKSFLNEYPEAKPHLIYGGTQPLEIEGVSVLPMEWTLKNLPTLLDG